MLMDDAEAILCIEPRSKLEEIFYNHQHDVFNDETGSEFGAKLEETIKTYGQPALLALNSVLTSGNANESIIIEALKVVGKIDDTKTCVIRLGFLCHYLESDNPYMREAASMGVLAIK